MSLQEHSRGSGVEACSTAPLSELWLCGNAFICVKASTGPARDLFTFKKQILKNENQNQQESRQQNFVW